MTRLRFVALDRDGTIIVERQYLSSPEQVELLPGAAPGLRAMREMGLGLVVVTNQSAVGRGYFDMARLEEIHERLRQLLRAEGVELAGIYVCPHAPQDRCACRKPLPGLLLQAARELGFDPAAAVVIGDKPCDIELGRGLGASTILVRTGYGAGHEAAMVRGGSGAAQAAAREVMPDHVADDLLDAAALIQQRMAAETPGEESYCGMDHD
jgi:D-glycero-D-manno-heptose 1,7-bisphosphate phosphatase